MRRACFAVVACACGGAPASEPQPVAAPARTIKHEPAQQLAPLDPIQTLSETHEMTSWILAHQAQLDLGDTPLAAGGDDEIVADVLEAQGSHIRVGVRLPNARFAIWISRIDLLRVISNDIVEVKERFASPTSQIDDGVVRVKRWSRPPVFLRRGAHVWGAQNMVRYFGALEVSGEIDERSASDRGRADAVHTRIPPAAKTVMVTPGTAIRAEPRWDARELAAVATAYFLTDVNELPDGWIEVEYDDSDVSVHGFVRKTDPPVALHRHRAPPIAPLEATVPLPNGTCLYAHEGGGPIGFIAGNQLGVIQTGVRAGWFAVSFETPWGVITFAARGTSDSGFETCGPAIAP